MTTTEQETEQEQGAERGTLAQFIERAGITATAEYADENPHMEDARDMHHYRVTLARRGERGRRQLTVFFSMGSAHTEEPSAADVLNCLALDAAGIDNAGSFDEWCGEYGYDTDSRKAERTYKACDRQAKKLRDFLTREQYDTLLYHTEGL